MPILTQEEYSLIINKSYTALYVTTPEQVTITAGTPESPSLNISEISGNLFDYIGGSLKYIGEYPITVKIDGSVSMTGSSSGIIVKLYYGKNGSIDARTEMNKKILTGSDVIVVPVNGQFDLVTNDTLDFLMDTSTNATITIEKAFWNITTVNI